MLNHFYKAWNKISAIYILLLSATFFFLNISRDLALAFLIPYIILIYGFAKESEGQFSINVPNILTTLRILGLLFFLFVSNELNHYALMGFLVLILFTDFFDGFFARKLNQSTPYGELYDMEADALFVCIVSLAHVLDQRLHWFILIPGLLKYVFALLPSNLTRFKEKPEKIIRSTIAVIFFISLLTPFFLGVVASTIINIVAGVLIVLSFGFNLFYNLKRQSY